MSVAVLGASARPDRSAGRGVAPAPAFALFTGLAGLAVLAMTIPLVMSGEMPGVILASIPLAAIASFEAVQPLGQALQVLQASRAAARRLFELVDEPAEVIDPPMPLPMPRDFSLEVVILSFRYSEDEPQVFDGLSFRLAQGKKLAILGPSGAGKTTLVNLLLRFWDYSNGQIRLGGVELHELRADEVRTSISVVAQDSYLFNTSLRDNLLLANPDASEEQITAASRQAQLTDFIAGLPQGYDTLIGENGLRLSGGERQRLAIARAILKDAPVLILDEATARRRESRYFQMHWNPAFAGMASSTRWNYSDEALVLIPPGSSVASTRSGPSRRRAFFLLYVRCSEWIPGH